MSATNQVYQSLATLIKLCDDVLLRGEKALNKQNVTEVLQQVEEAVQVMCLTIDILWCWVNEVPIPHKNFYC